jgi:hypothetical protein
MFESALPNRSAASSISSLVTLSGGMKRIVWGRGGVQQQAGFVGVGQYLP